MAKKLAQALLAAFLAALSLGIDAPLWAQSDHGLTLSPGIEATPPSEETGSRKKVGPKGSPAGEKPVTLAEEELPPPPAWESRGTGPFASEVPTAEAVRTAELAAEKAEPQRATTIKTESGQPLEVRIVGKKDVEVRWRDKTRWRTKTVRVPVGVTPAQVRSIVTKALRDEKIADQKSIDRVVNWAYGQFDQINKRLEKIDRKVDDLGREVRTQGEETRKIVREDGAQTRQTIEKVNGEMLPIFTVCLFGILAAIGIAAAIRR